MSKSLGTPRMRDVAMRAGVSTKTVSNVVNGFPHVRPATRERVERAIEALGYRLNVSARSLSRGRSGVIAFAVPELDMPYFASLSRAFVDQAQKSGWIVLVEQTLGDAVHEKRVIEGEFPQQVDGIVLSPVALAQGRIASRRSSLPLVLLGEHLTSRLIADHVVVDNVAAAKCAVSHLLRLGRRHIAFIGAARDLGRVSPRLRGYRRAFEKAGIPVDPSLLMTVDQGTGRDGEKAMDTLLNSGIVPDGVFCVTDWLGLGVLRALRLHGLDVPKDVAVVGFDDIPYSRSSCPSLTTIGTARNEVARLALESLERQLVAAVAPKPKRFEVAYELIPRESTLGVAGSASHDGQLESKEQEFFEEVLSPEY